MNRQAAPFFTLRNILTIARKGEAQFSGGEVEQRESIRFMWVVYGQERGRAGVRYATPYLTRKLHA